MTRGGARFAWNKAAVALLLFSIPSSLFPGVVSAQHFGVELKQDSARIGELVTVHVKIHIGIQQNLADRVPSLVGPLPEGVRVVRIDTLTVRRTMDGAVLEGDVRFAFYRPGVQDIPALRLILRPIASDRGQVMEHEPLAVRILATLPEGNPSLRDIRDQWPKRPLDPWLVAVALATAAALTWLSLRFRSSMARRPARPSVHPSIRPEASPYAAARAELEALAAGGLPETDVTAYYEAVSDVVRRYFVSVAPVASRAQTSSELLRALSSLSRNGAWHATGSVLFDADLVKFAAARPDVSTARRWAGTVGQVLHQWDQQLASAPLRASVDQPAEQG